MFNLCRNGRCRNTVGGVTCDCPNGYELTRDGRNCRDTNECDHSEVCPPPGTCQNTMGSYLCTCPTGYKLDATENNCVDVNECTEDTELCLNGFCENAEGGFRCQCPDGWILNSDKRDCTDTRMATCYNENRGRYCLGPRPMNVTRQSCCCTSGAAWGDTCEACPAEDTDQFRLLCPFGPGRGGTNGAPEDFNECDMIEDICVGGTCINTDGSFRCSCPRGFSLDSTGTKCVDVDECQTAAMCGNGTCTNLNGGFECQCSQGYAPGALGTCEVVMNMKLIQNLRTDWVDFCIEFQQVVFYASLSSGCLNQKILSTPVYLLHGYPKNASQRDSHILKRRFWDTWTRSPPIV